MADPVLLFTVEQGVAWLTLNRPESRNAINEELRELLLSRLADVASDATIRAAVLTGSGDGFCPGADLWGSKPPSGPPDPGLPRRLMRQNSQRLMRTLLDLEKPVLAAVNGVAAGLGAHLAFACDLVIAATEARFIEVFVRRGLAVDAAGAYLLTRLIGPQKTKELVFLGDALSADDAMHLGLVNRVVPRGELLSAARAWAERLASGPTFAIGMSKRLINRALDADLETCLEEEAFAQTLVSQTEDAKEGVRSFAERRPAVFSGR